MLKFKRPEMNLKKLEPASWHPLEIQELIEEYNRCLDAVEMLDGLATGRDAKLAQYKSLLSQLKARHTVRQIVLKLDDDTYLAPIQAAREKGLERVRSEATRRLLDCGLDRAMAIEHALLDPGVQNAQDALSAVHCVHSWRLLAADICFETTQEVVTKLARELQPVPKGRPRNRIPATKIQG